MRFLFLIFWLSLAPVIAIAQSAATLIADRISVDPSGVLVASGNVQIWQGDVTITATEVRYTRDGDRLTITGPIILDDGDRTTILASEAELDADLRLGVLTDARFILDKRLQVVAAEISREGDRYTQAHKIAATSCHICRGRTPIWQIRAQRMVHDRDERQIYFEHAQLRFFDIPVLYLPRVRLPDPSLERARGFLIPELKNNTRLGFGLKLPYFIPIGDHKDLTISPFFTSKTKTVEYRYRQAFRTGDIEFVGAFSDDELLPNESRGYVFGTGRFDLARGYELTFDIQAVSDSDYLSDYRYSDLDRLRSRVEVGRVQHHKNVEVHLSTYHSLRSTDDNSTIQSIVAEGIMEERFPISPRFGEVGYKLSFLASRRSSTLGVDGPDLDSEVDGFDVGRVSFDGYWNASHTFKNGLIVEGAASTNLDVFNVRQHAALPSNITNATGMVAATLRWPLMRKTSQGGHTVIEPVVQLAYVDGTKNLTPNQDSTRVEFDFGNIFNPSRSPGHDLKEFGGRFNIGLKGNHLTARGHEIAWNVGKVIRTSNPNTFSTTSGLSGTNSDWLIEAGFKGTGGMELFNRSIIADSGTIRKSETRLGFGSEKTNINASHTWLAADAAEDRTISVSELALTGDHALTDNWTLSTGLRYDFRTETLTQAGVGARYQNECIDISFSASKQFTGVPSTDYGLKIGLRGFGSSANTPAATHKCGG